MSEPQPKKEQVFRLRAVEHHARPPAANGLLRLAPEWTNWTFWLLLGGLIAALIFCGVAKVNEYASGPAIVRAEGRIDVSARVDGIVAGVSVQPGQRVKQGQPLVQLFTESEHAELQRIEQEFETQLLAQLRDPSDVAARTTLGSLRAQRELAQARIGERIIRAPADGVVSDLRVRAGQHVGVGDVVATVVGDDARLTLVALLPGRYRPMLHAGTSLRFELVGYRYEYRELLIESVGDEIVGPAEARRYLGPGIADSVAVTEPVVLVRATLSTRDFVSEGDTFHYFDGLQAQVQARVRSESILLSLMPEMKALLHHGH